ncbi:MAG: DNA-binding response regulator [Elusimicrobia bacterium CG08_land_8_20_14_0_20_59_10]|nr:MAG: DNA-binding response regulator [Elusimicrobia bacterium CG08_land_8_20_14_0_20_59_10]
MKARHTILVVDDELTLLRSVKERLELENFNVLTCTSAEQAIQTLVKFTPDLMVVDLRLPGMSGLDFCRQVRSSANASRLVPIIFLTTDRSEVSKVLGLELGGDDYLTKPFSPAEFIARVKALLRRSFSAEYRDEADEVVVSGNLSIDHPRHEAKISGRKLELSPKEFEILYLLVKKNGRVMTRQFLMERVWGRPYLNTSRVIDTHIKNLRKSLGGMSECLLTIEGLGYKWEPPT